MRVFLVACIVLLAGCSTPSDTDGEAPLSDGQPDPEAGPREENTRTVGVTLATVTGGPTTPGRVPVSFEVQHEEVREVEWRIEAAPNFIFLTYVDGPGCIGGPWGGGASPWSTTYGTCNNFKQGNHTVDLVFDVPIADWTFTMDGTATLNATK